MLRFILVAALAGTLSASAFAQSRTSQLSEALARLPGALFEKQVAEIAYYLDASAARSLLSSNEPARLMRRISASGQMRPVEALINNTPSDWSGKAGIDFAKIRYFAGFGEPPATVALWGLETEDQARFLLDALKKQDFSPFAGQGLVDAIANGKPFAANIAKRDWGNPWLGPIGQTSIIAPYDNALIQSASPEAVGFVQRSKSRPRLTDNPAIQAALAGLEKGAADGQIVQLFLFSPLLGLQQGDLSSVLLERKSPDEVARVMKAEMERNQQGIPPYFTGVMADVQFGDREGVVLSLAYPDCASAAEASAGIVHFWKADGFNDKTPAEITMIALPANEQLCAAAVTLRSADQTREGIFTRVRAAIFKREFAPLRIGLQPKGER